MTKMAPQNASEVFPQYAVMGFLYLHPMHGYDLHKQLQAHLGEIWHIRQSQAYSIMKRLEKEGMISATRQPQPKRPDRELLTLTDGGRQAFEIWLACPTPTSARALRVEFLTRIFFASQINSETCSRLIREQIEATRKDLAELEKHLASVLPDQVFNRMGLELRVRQSYTMMEWLESCESALSFSGTK